MVNIMRKIEIQRAEFKSAQRMGILLDPKMTFKAYVAEQALIKVLEVEQIPAAIPQSAEVTILEEAHQLLELIDDTLTTIDSAVVQLQDEVRTHIPDVSTTPMKKSDMARQIFNREQDDAIDAERPISRKTIINLFMSVAGLSKNGAATYYQNIKREKGMIGS
jgi:hypothetical protein